mgnify:FL=1
MRPSGSSLHRVEACGGELVLPQTREAESAWCSYGSVVHAFLRDVSVLGVEEALAAAPEEHRDALALVSVAELPSSRPDQYASEIAFAYDWRADTAREIGRGLSRDYSGLTADELPGTADLVGVTDDAVVVWDYKSGFAPLGPPRESPQLLFYALAAARTYRRDRAVAGFIRRLGDPIYSRAEFDSFDLDAAAVRVRTVMERAPITIPEGLVQGEHCRYCPSFGACPAKMALLRGLLHGDEMPVLSTETAPAVFARLLLAEEVLERVRATVQEYARHSPIRLPGGEVFGLVEVGRDVLYPELARPILVEAYGEEVASEAIVAEPKLTKAALTKALKGHMQSHPGLKISKLERAALELLRAGGACEKKFHPEMKVFTPKPALPEGAKP